MNIVYSQSCTANAGGDLNIILDHDGSPGGDITFDGSGTTGDNLGQFEWKIYHLPEDTLAYTLNGVIPIEDIHCYTSLNPDNTWTDCLADYRVELIVPCDDGQSDIDTINLSITEENDAPVACLTTLFDTWDVNGNGIWDEEIDNEALRVPNDNGIPGEETNVLLYTYIEFANCDQPDTDLPSFLWLNDEGTIISPAVSLAEGIYTFTFRRKDPYETYSELELTLELDEQNTIPSISISAINEADIGLNHIVVDGEQINLFGSILDEYNDVDDVDGDGNEDDISYNWNYVVIPNEILTIDNPSTLNPIITAPIISGNTESTEITITLEAQDPFQVLDGESSISDPIVITVVNDNTPPDITNTTTGYEIIEDGSSTLDYTSIDDYIDASDTDDDSFTLIIQQEDIDLDPITYANYSLTGLTTIVPNNDYYGQITIPIRLDDGYTVVDTCYNCLSDIAELVIDITGVNDAPVLSAPETLLTDEDLDLTITEISIQDVDSEPTGPNNFNLEFQITVEKGTLSLSPNTGSINYSIGDGVEDASMVFTASVTDFNNALSGSIFHPEGNYYGIDGKIIISVDDLGNNGIQDGDNPIQLTDSKIINVEINNVNDPPLITASDDYTIDEDENNFHLTDIVLSDEDVDNLQMILELTVSNGNLELSSTDDIICLEGGNCFATANNMQYRGTLDVLNASISNLHYIPEDDYNGIDVLEIRLNDMGNVGDEELEDIKNINISIEAINDAPFITSASSFSAFEDSLFNIENISVEDVDIDEGDGNLELAIDCPDCKVSLQLPVDGINFTSGNGFENNSMIFTGTLNDVNNAIENLDIIGNQDFCGFANLQITANDLGNYSVASTEETHTINISIDMEERNDPPVNEDPVTSQEVLPIISFSEDALSLSTTDGLWNDIIDEQCGPTSVIIHEYQWQRCAEEDEADCITGTITDIEGAISDIYDISSDDADNYLRSKVIAIDDGWGLPYPSTQSDSAYSIFVKMDNLPPYVLIDYLGGVELSSYEDSLYVFNLSAYVEDPDGNDVTFSIEDDINENHGLITLNENTGEVEFEPASNINFYMVDEIFVDFTYRVSDFQYTSADPGLIRIKILPRNDAPSFSMHKKVGNGNVFANENQENIVIDPWADPSSINDGDEEDIQELEFLIESISNESLFNNDGSGPIISIDSFLGILTFELADNANGTSDIVVVLKDNGGTDNYDSELEISEFDTSEPFQFTIDVTEINDPPLFDGGDDIVIDEDNGSFNSNGAWALNIDDGDPELDQQYEFILNVQHGADDMFIDLPQINPFSGELSFTPGEDMNGEIEVEVVLEDDGSNVGANIATSEPYTFKIIINAVNDAPTFSIDLEDQTIGDDILIYEDSGTQTFLDFAKDIDDGDPLSNSADVQEVEFVLTDLGNPDLFSVQPYIDDNGTLTFTPAANENGESTVEMILTDLAGTPNDGIDESIPQTFNVIITPLNDPPFFNLFHAESQLANGEEIIRNEDFSDPNTISIIPIRHSILENENDQSIVFSIEPEEAINANGEVFVNLDIGPLGEITFEMLPHGNGQASFIVKATDSGDGEEIGDGDINIYTRTFDLTISELADHPQIDLDHPSVLIEPFELQVDSLISVYHGTWIDTIDTDMSGTSNIIGYEYLWQAANNIDGDFLCKGGSCTGNEVDRDECDVCDGDWTNIEGLYDIGEFHADSIDYIITNNEAHKYIRSIVKAFDNGVGFVSNPEDDYFTDTTSWVQVNNTAPVALDDTLYFTFEDIPLNIDIFDGLISNNVADTTTDYDKDLDSIWVETICNNSIELIYDCADFSTVWGDSLKVDYDGSFDFYPSMDDNVGTNNFIEFNYILSDGETISNNATVRIEVGSLNDAPEFTIQDQNDESGSIIDTIEVLEDFQDCDCNDIKLGFSIPGHLPDDETSQVVTYSINPSSINFAELLFDQNEGSIQISPKLDWNGEQQFTVTATDDGVGEETGNGDDNDWEQTFYLKIVPVNDVPVFSLLGDTITILEDHGVFDTLNWVNFSDVSGTTILEDYQNLNYNISYINDADTNSTVWTFSSDPQIINDYDLNFHVSENDNGLSEVTITVQDDGGTTVNYLDNENYEIGVDESKPQIFYIKVLPVNDPPSYEVSAPRALDEDDGQVIYDNWITNISPGPPNESFQHKDLNFSITTYDKFWNELKGLDFNAPNNVLFKTPPALTIDETDTTKAHLSFELNDNHNGVGYIYFNISDEGGVEYSGIDTSQVDNSYIYVRQTSDKAEDFIVYSKPHEYAIDSTTFFIDTTSIEYFRLPYQDFAPDIQIPEEMRFSWERNDSLDLDTYLTTNLDTLFNTYYRLEMTSDSSDYTYVLFDLYKDSAEYINGLFLNDTSYFVNIAMNSIFPAYLDTFVFDDSPYDTTLYIDTTGFTPYQWNIVTQNYSRDVYNHDLTNTTISDRKVIVDLEVPTAEYSFARNDLYHEYYDLYFKTSEKTIENVANIWIDFSDTLLYRIPHKIDDYYFHLSSTFINTGIIDYNFQVRDLVENVGKTEKTIVFQFLEDGLAKYISSSDSLFSMYSTPSSVDKQTGIVLFAQDNFFDSSDIVQLTSEYHIAPYDQNFSNPIKVEFDNIDINDDIWKYKVRYKDESEWVELNTDIIDSKITADIIRGGIYSVFYDSDAPNPIPEEFKLVTLYPNPFNPILTIRYDLDIKQNIKIDIYNILGQRVTRLFDQEMTPGYHSVQWRGTNNQGVSVGSGIYFVKISNENQSYIRKVTLIK